MSIPQHRIEQLLEEARKKELKAAGKVDYRPLNAGEIVQQLDVIHVGVRKVAVPLKYWGKPVGVPGLVFRPVTRA